MARMVFSYEVAEYIGIFGFFIIFLSFLIRVAEKEMTKERKRAKRDDKFFKEHGYSFDYVMVFNVHQEEDRDKLSEYQQQYPMKNIVDRATAASLDYRCFFSCQRDEIYVKFRAELNRLKSEADRINYKLRLEDAQLQGRLEHGSSTWKKIQINDEKGVSSIPPFTYIYGKYSSAPHHQSLYKLYTLTPRVEGIFRGIDRIKLLISILEAPVSLHPPGCGLYIGDLVHRKAILAAFPLHDYKQMSALQANWLQLFRWKQPIEEVKDYFGERIAIYFLLLDHCVHWLGLMAILGIVTFVAPSDGLTNQSVLLPYFTIIMVIWSTFFVVKWKQKQAKYSMRWGSHGFEDEELDRPQFIGEVIVSAVDGTEDLYFSKTSKLMRSIAVNLVNTLFGFLVLGFVFVIYYVQYILVQQSNPYANYISAIMSSAVIETLNHGYLYFAEVFNDYENHRTDTEYEDNLIAKIFFFQLMNSFAALTYISFVKYFIGLSCIENDCLYEGRVTISTIMLVKMLIQAVEVIMHKADQANHAAEETEGLEPGVAASPIEEQYVLDEFDILKGTLLAYSNVVLQFGYTVLFVGSFPLSPTLFFLSMYVQIRISAWELCNAHRRPQPKTAEDVGLWQDMMEIMSFISVTTNLGLIFFTAQYLSDTPWEYRWIMFIAAELVFVVGKFVLFTIIPDVPENVEIQLKRQEFMVSKVIFETPDVTEEAFLGSKVRSAVIVTTTDDDWDDTEERMAKEAELELAEAFGDEGGETKTGSI